MDSADSQRDAGREPLLACLERTGRLLRLLRGIRSFPAGPRPRRPRIAKLARQLPYFLAAAHHSHRHEPAHGRRPDPEAATARNRRLHDGQDRHRREAELDPARLPRGGSPAAAGPRRSHRRHRLPRSSKPSDVQISGKKVRVRLPHARSAGDELDSGEDSRLLASDRPTRAHRSESRIASPAKKPSRSFDGRRWPMASCKRPRKTPARRLRASCRVWDSRKFNSSNVGSNLLLNQNP